MKKLALLARHRGYVIGRAIFADGRPVPNFEVQLLGFDGQINIFVGSTPYLGGGDAKNGRYAFRTMDSVSQKKPVQAIVTAVQLRTKINYHGQTYFINLCPLDGRRDGSGKSDWNANSAPGIVRDFVVKISGVKPQFKLYDQTENDGPNDASTFYGAQLTLNLDSSIQEARGSKLVVTLVPLGPLLDGSRGQTITRTATIGPSKYYSYQRNIPIGFYNVSATLTTPTGEVWKLRGGTTRENLTTTTSVLFPAVASKYTGGAETVSFYLAR